MPRASSSKAKKTATEETNAAADTTKRLLPVTVLSGFLGSGKTTLLQHILKNKSDWRVAVIVNDMAEINVDARTISGSISYIKESLVQMDNGCICCTLREDLLLEVKKLALAGKFDYIMIESTGIGEPLQVAETFTFDDLTGEFLKDFAKLDTMVTVVDGVNALRDLTSSDSLVDRKWESGKEDDRCISQLLVDQIEFANVILLNKCDLISEDDKNKLKGILKKLNPGARVLETVMGVIDPKEIINTNLFKFEEAEQNPGWLREVRGSHNPETLEYGISSFIYRARRPFHCGRLSKLLSGKESPFKNLYRVKGLCWMHSSMKMSCVWEQAGTQLDLRPGALWIAAAPKEQWQHENTPEILDAKAKWEEPYGDRRQELVFIGDNLKENKEKMIAALDACLLNDKEFDKGPESWKKIKDPIGVMESVDEMLDNQGGGDDDEDDEEEDGHHHHDHKNCSHAHHQKQEPQKPQQTKKRQAKPAKKEEAKPAKKEEAKPVTAPTRRSTRTSSTASTKPAAAAAEPQSKRSRRK